MTGIRPQAYSYPNMAARIAKMATSRTETITVLEFELPTPSDRLRRQRRHASPA